MLLSLLSLNLFLLLIDIIHSNSFHHQYKSSSSSIRHRLALYSTSSSSPSSLSCNEKNSIIDITKKAITISSLSLLLSPLSLLTTAKAADITTTSITHPPASDEIIIKIDPQSNLGLGLTEMKDSDRIIVSSIKDTAPADIANNIKPGFILISVEDKVIEGTSISKESIARAIKNTNKESISLMFRDPNKFFLLLNSTIPSSLSVKDISTRVSINNENNLLRVQRLELPSRNTTGLSAARYGDVVDIIYQARKVDGDGVESIVDGLSERIDNTNDMINKIEMNERQFFVLGSARVNKQNSLLSSPGLSLAMKGMVPGERRIISCPVRLLQKKALSDYYDQEVIFDITLVSLNGQRK